MKDVDKDTLMMSEMDMANGNENDSGENKEICNKCGSLNYKRESEVIGQEEIIWICCGKCDKWYHTPCAGFDNIQSESELENIDYVCCK